MELYLAVYLKEDNTFRVYKQISEINNLKTSVLKIDYNYRPWPHYEGNLLW